MATVSLTFLPNKQPNLVRLELQKIWLVHANVASILFF